ncbi:xylulose kinase [candidate division KSB3 bacterium]|uniref:Xylulose kinase n=1 Tax=candidate division KSB3 bacterium TaxID=2044937 RepID=A0A9D5Q7G9_9BACT|nr:xylulose kinase [candidate division KSB3 bacterium]MBD3326879.1 xylulose kinase [candidate division KSB3 bacterium]
MAEQYLIGIDIGTQGTKAALFAEGGRCLAEAFQKSDLHQPSPGIVEEDPETQVASVCATIKNCVQQAQIDPAAVAGIGIDGQMAGILGVGVDGRNVTPYDSWLDTRCAHYITVMQQEAGDEIVNKAGGPPSFNHGPKILWWMHEYPDVFAKVRAFVQPGGYAAMRLCGLDGSAAFIDTSYLHFSGFADNPHSQWDDALCRQFKLDKAKLPRIVDSHSVIGNVSPEMAEQCGVRPGVPVVAGCGDTAASFLSCGATQEGICVDVAGTASAFATTTKTFQPDVLNKTLGCGQSATPGLWHPYAYINGGGMNLEWFRKEIANQGVDADQGKLSFDELNRLVEALDTTKDDPLFIPHLGGRVCPGQPYLRGAWLNLNWNHTLGHLYKAVLEGVALEYGLYMHILRELYPHFTPMEIRITGGGERSRVWNQIKADALGIPVVQIQRKEGAPLGSALLAGFGVGLFDDLTTAAQQWIEMGETTKPTPEKFSLYQQRISRYTDFLEAINRVSVVE